MTPDRLSTLRWRRLDLPGREEARMERVGSGWTLRGELEVEEGSGPASLSYRITCDALWRTRSAEVSGAAAGQAVRLVLDADGAGHWSVDGVAAPALNGALDVDLGFTPSTNTLPIRRLALPVGGTASIRTAWLRFPELLLEPLEQSYTRESDRIYRFDAVIDGDVFTARLTVGLNGWVLGYEGLWEAEEER